MAISLLLGPLHVAGPLYTSVAALLGVGFLVWGLAGLRGLHIYDSSSPGLARGPTF